MNSGERDELLIKLYLVYMRDNNFSFAGMPIYSVGFDGLEYDELPSNISPQFNLLNDFELTKLAKMICINKASARDKSDVYINEIGYSLKSFSGAPPALVNHTKRPGFETACKHVGISITNLDTMIDKYWNLRLNGKIGEDIKNTDVNSPFKDNISTLGPILEYFLFTGTGNGVSDHPAEYILDYSNPNDPNTWKILAPCDALKLLWGNLIFSIRSKKGMPSNYDKTTYRGNNYESIARWTEYCDGDYRGALHIRVHR